MPDYHGKDLVEILLRYDTRLKGRELVDESS